MKEQEENELRNINKGAAVRQSSRNFPSPSILSLFFWGNRFVYIQ